MEDKKEKIFCPICKKFKTRYSSVDYCQSCYRKILDEYSLYDYVYKDEKEQKKHMSRNAIIVCRLLVEHGIRDTKEISRLTKLNQVYVRQIIHKFTIKVNTNGEVRPF